MRKKTNLKKFVVMGLLLLSICCAAAFGDIIYVDADAIGLNNGSSWTDAYTSLQDGLVAAVSGDEIWVAAGTYYPSVRVGGTGDRYKTFQMKNGVAIYGGFAATGDPAWEDRDPDMHKTKLSGDLNGDDVEITDPAALLDETSRSDNSYHVVTGSNTDLSATLDGFIILGGNASGYVGGGIFNDSGSPRLNNCVVRQNSAYLGGGGMFNGWSSNPTVTNCRFTDNFAGAPAEYYGGGGNV